MAASDHLHPTLFHGTAHWFSPGDTIEPTDSLHSVTPLAYASKSMETAGIMGGYKARAGEARSAPGQTSLFAPVYEVEHNTPPARGGRRLTQTRRAGSATDPSGFTVRRLAGLYSPISKETTLL